MSYGLHVLGPRSDYEPAVMPSPVDSSLKPVESSAALQEIEVRIRAMEAGFDPDEVLAAWEGWESGVADA